MGSVAIGKVVASSLPALSVICRKTDTVDRGLLAAEVDGSVASKAIFGITASNSESLSESSEPCVTLTDEASAEG